MSLANLLLSLVALATIAAVPFFFLGWLTKQQRPALMWWLVAALCAALYVLNVFDQIEFYDEPSRGPHGFLLEQAEPRSEICGILALVGGLAFVAGRYLTPSAVGGRRPAKLTVSPFAARLAVVDFVPLLCLLTLLLWGVFRRPLDPLDPMSKPSDTVATCLKYAALFTAVAGVGFAIGKLLFRKKAPRLPFVLGAIFALVMELQFSFYWPASFILGGVVGWFYLPSIPSKAGALVWLRFMGINFLFWFLIVASSTLPSFGTFDPGRRETFVLVLALSFFYCHRLRILAELNSLSVA